MFVGGVVPVSVSVPVSALSIRGVLSLLRLSHHDSDVFYNVKAALIERANAPNINRKLQVHINNTTTQTQTKYTK